MSKPKKKLKTKRTNCITWDQYFMGVAVLASKRSKDPVTQTGAVIVDSDKKIVSIGYNGFPIGCKDDEFPWDDSSAPFSLESKHMYVVHSELNAILNAHGANLVGDIMYTTLFPCAECAKAIINVGISRIVFLDIKYNKTYTEAAKRMFNAANVHYTQYKPSFETISFVL